VAELCETVGWKAGEGGPRRAKQETFILLADKSAFKKSIASSKSHFTQTFFILKT